MKIVHALDFGTSNTLMGAGTSLGIVDTIPLDSRSANTSVIKSVMYSPSAYEWYFGEEAYMKYLEQIGQGRFFKSFKSLLARESFSTTSIHGQKISVVDLVARYLREVRQRGNSFYQQDIEDVIVGRPCRFSTDDGVDKVAESRLIESLKKAGYKNIEFIYEPVAAAKAMKGKIQGEKYVAIVDLGAGTSDFAIVKLNNGRMQENDVLSVAGINLAGDTYDYQLMKDFVVEHFGASIKTKNGLVNKSLFHKISSPEAFAFINDYEIAHFVEPLRNEDLNAVNTHQLSNLESLFINKIGFDLFRAIENTKINNLDSIAYQKFGIDLFAKIDNELKKASFETLTEKVMSKFDECLNVSGLSISQIDFVVVTGGTSKTTHVQNILTQKFHPSQIINVDATKQVVRGLAHFAHERAKGIT